MAKVQTVHANCILRHRPNKYRAIWLDTEGWISQISEILMDFNGESVDSSYDLQN